MLNILARMIFQLIPVACPDHFASGDVYTPVHFESCPGWWEPHPHQPRLGGLLHQHWPIARFIRAWYMLLDFLRSHVNVGDNEVFSVYPGKTNNPGDIKGCTFRRLNDSMSQERLWTRMYHLAQKQHWICKPLRWVNAARCIRQRRGSLMGSLLSPALCLMVIWIPGLQRKPSLHEFCTSLSNRCWLSCPGVCHLAWHGSVRFCPGQFLGFSTQRERERERERERQKLCGKHHSSDIPVGLRYSSLPWANFRSQRLLACGYRSAANGRANGSQPSTSSLAVKAGVQIVRGNVRPLSLAVKAGVQIVRGNVILS